jgi:hypothetical protein
LQGDQILDKVLKAVKELDQAAQAKATQPQEKFNLDGGKDK